MAAGSTTTATSVSILVADDSYIMRRGLRRLLESDGNSLAVGFAIG
jgi:CheY-like chemotaxis protein